MTRGLAALAVVATLAACTSAPKKPAAPTATASAPPAQSAPQRRISPYAPAQEDLSKRGDYVAGGLYAPHIRDSAPAELHDVHLIPEPDVVALPRSRHGNRSPYTVLGRQYAVMDDTRGYVEQGIASFYGNKFHGRRTSNLEVYDMYAFTAAHRSLPLPSFARVTNLENGTSVVVRVNDRGPFHEGRLVDLSFAAAARLGITRRGTGRVEVRALQPGDVPVLAGSAAPTPGVAAATSMQAPATIATAAVAPVAVEPLPPAHAAASAQPPAGEHRFDMQRDGRTMRADEFDAWMRERRLRVATGRPLAAAAASAPGASASASTTVSTVSIDTLPSAGSVLEATAVAHAGASSSHASSIAPRLPSPASVAHRAVTLQVAAFGAPENAHRALALLHGAGIGGARVEQGQSAGRPVWRLRLTTADAGIDALASRLAGLGFGPPRRVLD